MSDRNGRLRITVAVLMAALLAGCGLLPGDDEEDEGLVVGTTSAPSVLDPAAAWDGSWELYRNIYQTLMHFPNSSSSPEPDAAQRCDFTDTASRVYRCTLRAGTEFSNGHPLDAEAVKFSFDRIRKINAKTGPAALLSSLDRVEALDRKTVVFHLEKSDATFPYVLATPATAIVDPAVYPADKLLKGNEIAGSGPYGLESYRAGGEAVLARNEKYEGAAKVKNDGVTIRYYKQSAKMVRALQHEDIDVIYRGLTPGQVTDLQEAGVKGSDEVELREVTGTEIRYLVFNPEFDAAGKPAVRKAVAQLIDRQALVRNVYERTAEPLYSMVPTGITGHTNAYYDEYGDPSEAKAEKTLESAGIDEKVKLTLWYPTDRYGATAKSEFEEIERQLEASGLFDITIEGREWNEFQTSYTKGEYPVFGRGWFPDFPDADNYVSPFVGKENAMGTPYENTALTDDLLPRSRKESDRGVAGGAFREVQKILAEDARLLPLWQGKVFLAANRDVAGLEWCLDPSTIMNMGQLSRKSSW